MSNTILAKCPHCYEEIEVDIDIKVDNWRTEEPVFVIHDWVKVTAGYAAHYHQIGMIDIIARNTDHNWCYRVNFGLESVAWFLGTQLEKYNKDAD